MTTDKLVRMRALLNAHITGWFSIAPGVQNQIAHFILDDRVRHRDQIMLELGHHPQPPDDNPIPGGSPI